ncbi:hypothetical protein Pedsa_1294 [Pseudopedobacter saltans DSM 12145]|uniref:Uncharacterized protein n=1 Tax=Pseudopedobacter saltans (strain ATCC 51119 / DSM 12145 / JCM 21818 / CCUG 39354 / LMG 10337 / NBRC 100064 / NCIMB 13643) TaxID=762903 RepID=F0SDW5_PSESL|nr:hypothetical protein Pedsa_1294 [Pseudopedobacter saltans DSM 12145]
MCCIKQHKVSTDTHIRIALIKIYPDGATKIIRLDLFIRFLFLFIGIHELVYSFFWSLFVSRQKGLGQPPAMRRSNFHSSYRHSTNIIVADILFSFLKKKQKHFLFMALALSSRSGKNDIAPTFLCYSAF